MIVREWLYNGQEWLMMVGTCWCLNATHGMIRNDNDSDSMAGNLRNDPGNGDAEQKSSFKKTPLCRAVMIAIKMTKQVP